jgi:hypothetical protein
VLEVGDCPADGRDAAAPLDAQFLRGGDRRPHGVFPCPDAGREIVCDRAPCRACVAHPSLLVIMHVRTTVVDPVERPCDRAGPQRDGVVRACMITTGNRGSLGRRADVGMCRPRLVCILGKRLCVGNG